MTHFSGAVYDYRPNPTWEFTFSLQTKHSQMTDLGRNETSMTHKSANQTQKKDNKLVKEQCPQAIEHLGNKKRVMNLMCS